MDAFAQWLHGTAFSQWLQITTWVIPLLQSVHIVMIGLVFISSLMIALRVLGRMRADEPLPAVWSRFAPWMWSGLVVMAATGALLIIAEPPREFGALSFWIKMGLVLLAVVLTTLLGAQVKHAPHDAASPLRSARPVACVLVVLWIAIIFLGRAIAYDVEVWGRFSPHA